MLALQQHDHAGHAHSQAAHITGHVSDRTQTPRMSTESGQVFNTVSTEHHVYLDLGDIY